MKNRNWILVLLIILIAMPTHAGKLVLKENQEILKLENIETLMMEQNPTIQINNNTKENLRASKHAIRDAMDDKRDLEDAVDSMNDAIDGIKKAIKAQDEMIGGLNEMAQIGSDLDFGGVLPDLGIPIDPEEGIYEGVTGIYQGIIGSQIGTLQFVKALYQSNIASLEQNRDAMEEQLKEFEKLPAQELELDKAILQIDMGGKSIIWGAKNLYLGHASLERQRKEMIQNLEILEVQIDIMKVQEELGMITSLDLVGVENQKDQMILGIKTMETQMDNLKRELNIMLGQDINKDIELEDTFIVDEETISKVNFEDDLSLAKENSYSMEVKEYDYEIKDILMKWENRHGSSNSYRSARRELENVETEIKEEEKNLELSFTKLYQDLENKIVALGNERQNLEYIQEKDDILELKYELGIISKVELKQGKSEYYNQTNLVKAAEQEAFQILLQYESLIEGMNFLQ